MYEILTDTKPIEYLKKIMNNAKISFCVIYGRPHFFILVENTQKPYDKVAFSYVPESTKKYIDTGKGNSIDGYSPFITSKSYVVDTCKLTVNEPSIRFIRLFHKKCNNWKFNLYPEFNKYNVLSIIPRKLHDNIITDCVGYSWHHYVNAKQKN